MGQVIHTALETRLEVQKLNSLPAMSLVVNQFLDACTDSEVAIERLSGIIEKDPSLLARIIGVANSAFYSPSEPITSAHEAIFQVLGVDMAKNLALGIVLSGPFSADKCPLFPLDRFWLESVVTATLAHDLAPLVSVDEKIPPGDAYLSGLLHSFGLLVLVHLYPDEMNDIIARSHTCCSSMALIGDEREVLQADHLETGGWLGRKWHLPETIVLVMENYLVEEYRGAARSLVQLINFSTRWASSVLSVNGEMARPEPTELSTLGINEDRAKAVLDKVFAQLDELRAMAHEFSRG
jgi:HD-like signal output (HDOD) protein